MGKNLSLSSKKPCKGQQAKLSAGNFKLILKNPLVKRRKSEIMLKKFSWLPWTLAGVLKYQRKVIIIIIEILVIMVVMILMIMMIAEGKTFLVD